MVASIAPPSSSPLRLTSVDLSDCPIGDSSLRLLVSSCPSLSSLLLRRCADLTDLAPSLLASRCPKLLRLSLAHCPQLTDQGASCLSSLPMLAHLSLAGLPLLTDTCIPPLARHCKRLSYLNLRGCVNMTDVSAASLATGLPRLRALDMGRSLFLQFKGGSVIKPAIRWQVTDAGLKLVAKYLPGLVRSTIIAQTVH